MVEHLDYALHNYLPDDDLPVNSSALADPGQAVGHRA
jgi:hypothetical protein